MKTNTGILEKQRIIILGAAGRDFHNFKTLFRKNSKYEVVVYRLITLPG